MFKKVLLLIMGIMLILSIGVESVSAGLVTDFLLKKGKGYYEEGDFKNALRELRKALLVEPGNGEIERLVEQIETEQRRGWFVVKKEKAKRTELTEAELMAGIKKRAQIEQEAKEKEERLNREIENTQKKLAQEKKEKLELEKEKKQAQTELKELAAREAKKKQKIIADLDEVIALLKKTQAGIFSEEVEKEKRVREKEATKRQKLARLKIEGEEKERTCIKQEVRERDEYLKSRIKEAEKRLVEEKKKRLERKRMVLPRLEELEKKEKERAELVKAELKDEERERVEIEREARFKKLAKIEAEKEEKPIKLAMGRKPSKEERARVKNPVPGMKAVINGENLILKHPVRRRNGQLRVSLGDAAKSVGVLVIPGRDNKFKIIRPDGDFMEIELDKKDLFKDEAFAGELKYPPLIMDNEVMVTLGGLDKLLGSTSRWDEQEQKLYLDVEYVMSDMDTFTIAKPKTAAPRRERVYIAPPPPWQKTAKKPFSAGELTLRPTIRYYRPDQGDMSTDFKFDLSGRLYGYRFRGEAQWEEENERQRYQRGYLEMSKPGEKWRFIDNFIDLRPLSGQYESFKGVKFVKSPKSSPITFFFGETENFASGSQGSVEYDGLIFGLGKEYEQKGRFKYKGMLIGTLNESNDPLLTGTTSYPEKSLILFTDTTLYPFPYLSLSNQLAVSSYTPDDGSNKNIQDFDWRLGSSYEKEKLNLSGSYEFVGDKYASLGNAGGYQDIQRWDVYSRYKLRDDWSITAGYAGSEDNVDHDSTKSTTRRDIFYTGTNFSFPTRQSIGLNWRVDNSETENTGGETTRNRGNSLTATFRQPGKIVNLLGTYHRFWTDYSTAASDYISDSLSLSLYRAIPKGYVNLRQRISQTDYETAATDKKTYSTTLGFNYRLNPRWENRFTSTRTSTESESANDTSNLSLRYSTSYALTRDIKTTLNYTKRKADSDWSENWSLFLVYSHPFNIIAPPRWGKIRGRVVYDLNNNYRADEDEPGLAGIWVRLEDGSSAQTDEDGYYVIEEASPGRQQLFLDIADLPQNLGPQGRSEREIFVKTRGAAEIDFMAVKLGSISGRLFIDANNNGDFDPDEQGIEGMVISLLPEERNTKTLSDGTFNFDYAHPGKVKVGVNTDSLPERYLLTSVDNWQLDLPVGGKLADIHFFGRLRLPEEMPEPPKPIIIQYEEKQSEEEEESF